MVAPEQEMAASSTFRFEDLPAELQVRVIEFAVIENGPIMITHNAEWHTKHKRNPRKYSPRRLLPTHKAQPEISKVSKQVRVEALKAYYKHNDFQAGYCEEADHRRLCRWLRAIGEKNRSLIKNLTIAEPWELRDLDDTCCFKIQSRDTELRKLGAALTDPEGQFGVVRVSFPEKKG